MGVESGVQRILDYIGKNEKLADFQRAAKTLNSLGFAWKAYCIIGFPEETEADMFETISFVKSLVPSRITLSFFTPYEGTSLYNECVAEGLIPSAFDVGDFFHQSPCNFFSKNMSKERYDAVREQISSEVDQYNKTHMKISEKDG
jgi:radical SAM superfamily enzyme YgiQ (UPF0313 family)